MQLRLVQGRIPFSSASAGDVAIVRHKGQDAHLAFWFPSCSSHNSDRRSFAHFSEKVMVLPERTDGFDHREFLLRNEVRAVAGPTNLMLDRYLRAARCNRGSCQAVCLGVIRSSTLNEAFSNVISRLFTHHPRSVGESYAEHAKIAGRFGFVMATAGLKCLLHALVPAVWPTAASDAVRALHRELDRRREQAAPCVIDYVI